MESKNIMNKPLTRELAGQMIAALHTINNIENNPDRDKQPTDEVAVADAKLFLEKNFVEHASEFLGSWIAVANEYEPMVASFAALQRRASAINGLKMQQQLASAQHADKKSVIVPANVIPASKNFRKR